MFFSTPYLLLYGLNPYEVMVVFKPCACLRSDFVNLLELYKRFYNSSRALEMNL